MLKIDHLSASYKTIDGNVHVVKDCNFEIRDNEIFGIAGESGCGKSTLLKTLYDIIEFPLEIDQGKVIEYGTYRELLQQKGEFYKQYKIQSEALKTIGIISYDSGEAPEDDDDKKEE